MQPLLFKFIVIQQILYNYYLKRKYFEDNVLKHTEFDNTVCDKLKKIFVYLKPQKRINKLLILNSGAVFVH